jgi:hypothetical protein
LSLALLHLHRRFAAIGVVLGGVIGAVETALKHQHAAHYQAESVHDGSPADGFYERAKQWLSPLIYQAARPTHTFNKTAQGLTSGCGGQRKTGGKPYYPLKKAALWHR